MITFHATISLQQTAKMLSVEGMLDDKFLFYVKSNEFDMDLEEIKDNMK
jgi:hypothetical protein